MIIFCSLLYMLDVLRLPRKNEKGSVNTINLYIRNGVKINGCPSENNPSRLSFNSRQHSNATTGHPEAVNVFGFGLLAYQDGQIHMLYFLLACFYCKFVCQSHSDHCNKFTLISNYTTCSYKFCLPSNKGSSLFNDATF